MADKRNSDDILTPEVAGGGQEKETDSLFRAQMGVYQFFAKNWKTLLGLLGVFLLCTFVYSVKHQHDRDVQRDGQAKIADIDRRMPLPNPLSVYGAAPMDDLDDQARMNNIEYGAERFEEIAADTTGTAAIMAWVKAAESYDRLNDEHATMRCLNEAHALNGEGILGWSVASQLANQHVDMGSVEEAVAVYQEYVSGQDIYAEQASYQLGILFESQGRADESREVLEDFGVRFPESALGPQIDEILFRLQG